MLKAVNAYCMWLLALVGLQTSNTPPSLFVPWFSNMSNLKPDEAWKYVYMFCATGKKTNFFIVSKFVKMALVYVGQFF